MKFELAATVREQAGKGVARAMRRAGKIPAVLYGQGECMLLSVSPTSLMNFQSCLAMSNTRSVSRLNSW